MCILHNWMCILHNWMCILHNYKWMCILHKWMCILHKWMCRYYTTCECDMGGSTIDNFYSCFTTIHPINRDIIFCITKSFNEICSKKLTACQIYLLQLARSRCTHYFFTIHVFQRRPTWFITAISENIVCGMIIIVWMLMNGIIVSCI